MADYKVKRIDDRTLYSIVIAARDAGNKEIERCQEEGILQGSEHQITAVFSSGLPWQPTDEQLREAPPSQFMLERATLGFRAAAENQPNQSASVSFSYQRGGDSILDTLSFQMSNHGNGVLNGDGEQRVLRAIHEKFSPIVAPVAPEDGGTIATLSNLAQSFSTTYQRIATELSTAVARVSQERAEQLREFQQERTQLRDEIAEERRIMHEEAEREFEAERDKILEAKAQIDEQWTKLEISSHKDARRKQFTQLQVDLQKSLATPVADSGLRRIRWAVFASLILAGLIAGWFAYGSITAGTAGSQESIGAWMLPAIRSVILSLVSLTAIFGAAAWLRYFYNRDMQAQEELRRFRNDMARASWVMDAALEIRKEHNEEIPKEWIAGVTDGLFNAQRKESLEEGAQALAALMGLSASASFGPGGATVQLGKKGGRVIAAAARDME